MMCDLTTNPMCAAPFQLSLYTCVLFFFCCQVWCSRKVMLCARLPLPLMLITASGISALVFSALCLLDVFFGNLLEFLLKFSVFNLFLPPMFHWSRPNISTVAPTLFQPRWLVWRDIVLIAIGGLQKRWHDQLKKTFIGEKHLRQHYLLMTTDCTDCLHLEYLPEICILMARREITHKLLLKNVWMAQLSLPCGSGGGLRKQPVRRAWADGHLAARQQLY